MEGGLHNPWEKLIQPGMVHGSLYSDELIFKEELEKIWFKTWVYVGHESEVPNTNDFVTKSVGPMPVLMVRNQHGEISLLLNRCPHRGNAVCVQHKGNRKSFTCPYHSWTFANDGRLMNYAFPEGYAGTDKSGLGLAKVPRVASYRGFVFASMAQDGPSLEQHLGGARRTLDQACENSPTGELDLSAGFLRHRTRANWKFILENECDGYHPAFVHSSIFSVADSAIGSLYGNDAVAVTRGLGNGHTEVDPRPEFRRRDQPMSWFGTTADKLPEYTAQMNAAYGDERARQIMIDGMPHVMIFPNLFIAEIQIFVIQPVSAVESIQHVTAIQFKDSPEINRRLRQQTMGSVGPAGFLLADDTEMYERNQRGLEIRSPEYLYLKRGEHRERRDDDGFVVGHSTDDLPSREIWKHYRTLMEAC
ncbi:aromatic ring-hydroxylating dioxygenase subunit alpha [Rhodopseudomonas palustris]|uniref:Aromatic ring-hydroxylating dioxygenase subunit alpha n=1 Tax=Rhodopseudomonas palustris TaxID=1076 RepID=A0A323UI29_RHOPL|nr:aromatic ring-hydroxylating dioxygenase subunit alpha [Rhodopseudomonas palustris]PZA11773.1 aromatic ring-hydroxylating dioxygenase subunit alpha [Rhodopseudomonas palustris]